jgi:hypothetical protein
MSVLTSIMSKVFLDPHNRPGQPVDLPAMLNRMAEERPIIEPLDWGQSMADLLKLLSLDSGPHAQRALALELRYSGDPNDMLHMNRWLHREVMNRLAEKGAKVPPELRH